ncbi:hypothetical protein [Aureispira sp. CCB-E]|uniref:hypothetical protein n=1 Tax=Aureispira sp. CCB-E TaxID=3051121 RepID=UPI0028689764|nr:hypothetical protein [Aureispira sp. CCB-E]WMX12462.1 hypothetical protein QP953_16660 [Aureispira sp. CCB-E]
MKKNTLSELRITKKHIISVMVMPSIIFSFLFYHGFINPTKDDSNDTLFIYSIMIILILWAITYIWNALKYKLTVTDQFIHLKSLFTDKKILAASVDNYKTDQYGLHIYIKNYSESPCISITANLDNSEILYTWLAYYSKNLETETYVRAYEDELKEILSDNKYGKNKIEKEENIASVNHFVKILNRFAFILFILIFVGSLNLFPIPYILLDISIFLTILIPIILVYFSLRYQGFFSLDEEQNKISHFPSIFESLINPNISLSTYWLLTGFYIFDISTIWTYALVISLLITFPIFYSARDVSFKKIGDYFGASLAVILMLGYGYGTIAYLNFYFDKSEAQIYPVEILNKRSGKNNDSAKHITLAPWSTYNKPQEVEVLQSFFHKIEKGDKVNIYLKEGYLGIKYYSINT